MERKIVDVVCGGYKPTYANSFAAGLDLRSNTDVLIKPGRIADISTKLAMSLPSGYFGILAARSGMSFNHQVKLINDIGVIDEDYRGNIGIRLINEGQDNFFISKGDRVAQVIIIPYIQVELNYVDELDYTERGINGFGSTGQ